MLRFWDAVCRHGPCGPICSLHPWDKWVPPDLHGFYEWVFDAMDLLNNFTKQVVFSRRDNGIRKWVTWFREDLSSRPYAWLRPDFVLPSPFLVVKDPQTKSSQILVEHHLIDAEFRKAWMSFFCRSGHPVVTPDQFLDFVLDISCLKNLIRIFLELRYGICRKLLGLKGLLQAVWLGGRGMRLGAAFTLVFWSGYLV